jgi:hypothetical protein
VPVFPSEAWCRAIAEAAEGDPELELAAHGWEGDLGMVVEGEGARPPFAAWVRMAPAAKLEWRVLGEAESLDALGSANVLRASYSTGRGVMTGRLDPMEAVLFRKVKFKGNPSQLLDRLHFKQLASRVLAAVDTRFADEET